MIARACTATAALALMAGAAQADVTLTILHTNDVHARFEPVGSSGSSCTAEDDSAVSAVTTAENPVVGSTAGDVESSRIIMMTEKMMTERVYEPGLW